MLQFGKFVLTRAFLAALTLVIISLVVFTLMEFVPGDCAERYLAFKNTQGSGISVEDIEIERKRLGLDKPFVQRWTLWIVNAFQGEFGDSCILRVNIAQLLGTKFWLSLGICLSSLLLAYMIALPVGIISAASSNAYLNNGLKLISYLGLAMPNFLLALMIMLFSTIYFGDTLTGLFSKEYRDAEWSIDKFDELGVSSSSTLQYYPSFTKYAKCSYISGSDGNKKWTQQIGTSTVDHGHAVITDSSNNIYVTGRTWGSFDSRKSKSSKCNKATIWAMNNCEDIFIAKYNSSGDQIWIEQIFSTSRENPKAISIDSLENIYITGFTNGALNGANSGGNDIFLIKYSSDGVLQFKEQFGSSKNDIGLGVRVDSKNNVYLLCLILFIVQSTVAFIRTMFVRVK